MDASAIVTMVSAMLVIWGGLVMSIIHAVRVSRADRLRGPDASATDG